MFDLFTLNIEIVLTYCAPLYVPGRHVYVCWLCMYFASFVICNIINKPSCALLAQSDLPLKK
jgi:hypothetical protein